MQTNAAATYYQDLITYLHTNFPGIPVMVSPFYAGLQLTPAQFALAVSQLWVGTIQPDIIALQSGAGDASIGAHNMTPGQISAYFAAVSSALAGSRHRAVGKL